MTEPQEQLIEALTRQRDNAIRLLNEQSKAMQVLQLENNELRKVLQVRADMQATVDQVNKLTAEQFQVTIERVT